MKRVVLIGAESTGKSTLAAALSDALQIPCTTEYVRDYVARLERPLAAHDLDPIARGQLAEEDRFPRAPVVLHDTNLLSTLLYARHYFQASQPWLEQALAAREYALYLFCQPDIPWVADPGQREGPQVRAQLHAVFEAELARRNLPTVPIAGPHEVRLRAARDAIDAVVP